MTWHYVLLIPVFFASSFWLTTTICMAIFFRKKRPALETKAPKKYSPFISLLKPVCGLEKNLYENLITACEQDYPDYEIIYSVQSRDDTALEILKKIRIKYPQKRIQIVIDENAVGPNGRLANIYNGSQRAKGEVLVFSDSDMVLKPDYLKTIVAPLADEKVGVSCTLYKARNPVSIIEALELLSFNVDFVPSMIFAIVTKVSIACPGATQAIRRKVLEKIGGLEPLGHYLVEDYELGRRVVEKGHQIHFVPYVADTEVDLKTFRDWWRHQVYWDQNTRAANPSGFFFTILIRGIPFAFLYALLGGLYGWIILLGTIGMRVGTALSGSFFLKDKDGMKSSWMLPIRDLLGIFVWLASFIKRKTYWRGRTFALKKGKMVEVL